MLLALVAVCVACSTASAELGPTRDVRGLTYDGPVVDPFRLTDVRTLSGNRLYRPYATFDPSVEERTLLFESSGSVGGIADRADSFGSGLSFESDQPAPVLLSIGGLAGDEDGALPGAAMGVSGGSTWTDPDSADWDGGNTSGHAPAPGAALLGAVGLGLVGWLKRRFT